MQATGSVDRLLPPQSDAGGRGRITGGWGRNTNGRSDVTVFCRGTAPKYPPTEKSASRSSVCSLLDSKIVQLNGGKFEGILRIYKPVSLQRTLTTELCCCFICLYACYLLVDLLCTHKTVMVG